MQTILSDQIRDNKSIVHSSLGDLSYLRKLLSSTLNHRSPSSLLASKASKASFFRKKDRPDQKAVKSPVVAF